MLKVAQRNPWRDADFSWRTRRSKRLLVLRPPGGTNDPTVGVLATGRAHPDIVLLSSEGDTGEGDCCAGTRSSM